MLIIFFFTILLHSCHCLMDDSKPLHFSEKIKMRDGIELETKVFFSPGQIFKKNPVILLRTPYGTDSARVDMVFDGFIVIVQDMRGIHRSTGKFSFFRFSGTDYIDTVKWIENQFWSNGDIGTVGFSGPGIVQYMAVYGNPYEEVKTPKFQCVGAASILAHEHLAYQGGALRFSLTTLWLKFIEKEWYFDTLVENEAFNEVYWGPLTITESTRIRWPSVHLGGWYDIFSEGTLKGYELYRKNPQNHPQYLVMVSGGHCEKSNFVFPRGNDYNFLYEPICQKLCKLEKPLQNRTNFYVINLSMNGTASSFGNFWVSMKDFPESKEKRFYLGPSHRLYEQKISEEDGNVTFSYDPNNPTKTIGGNNLLIPCGPRDQISNELREDNIVFTTEPFEDYFSIVGNIRVNLVVSTNRNDTDFVCRLTDVSSNGTKIEESLLLNDGIVRMKWKKDPSQPNLLVPFQKYSISVDLWSMAAIISPGHRLRVACTSSNYPRFSINGNSGKVLKDETKEDYLVAQNTIYFGEGSYLSLPMVDLRVLQRYIVD